MVLKVFVNCPDHNNNQVQNGTTPNNDVHPGYSQDQLPYRDVQPGYSDAQPGYSDDPPGYIDTQAGYSYNEPGYSELQPGYSDQAANEENLENDSILQQEQAEKVTKISCSFCRRDIELSDRLITELLYSKNNLFEELMIKRIRKHLDETEAEKALASVKSEVP